MSDQDGWTLECSLRIKLNCWGLKWRGTVLHMYQCHRDTAALLNRVPRIAGTTEFQCWNFNHRGSTVLFCYILAWVLLPCWCLPWRLIVKGQWRQPGGHLRTRTQATPEPNVERWCYEKRSLCWQECEKGSRNKENQTPKQYKQTEAASQ